MSKLSEVGELVNFLETAFPLSDDSTYQSLVNFRQNRSMPIHSWFDYKQGYSPELIGKLVKDLRVPKDGNIFDPFNGVGTTLLAADNMGLSSLGLDVNPVAVLASEVKNRQYSVSEIDLIESTLADLHANKPEPFPAPKYKSLPRIFSDAQLRELLVIRSFFEQLEIEWLKSFFRLAFLSIVEPVSNRVKDGNGIKIAKNKTPVSDVIGFFSEKVTKMVADLRLVRPNGLGKTMFGSILDDELFAEVAEKKFSAAIFSPPYANCFDYLEVYKMEMWMGGFVHEYSDFSRYRSASIRSHVNSRFSKVVKHEDHEVAVIRDALDRIELWNKNIPAMVAGYFDDMTGVLKRTFELLDDGGGSAIVVANSSYRGVIVPTDLLLAKVAKNIGFRVEKVIKARNIRGSSQHMARTRSIDSLMRESIIILRKN